MGTHTAKSLVKMELFGPKFIVARNTTTVCPSAVIILKHNGDENAFKLSIHQKMMNEIIRLQCKLHMYRITVEIIEIN